MSTKHDGSRVLRSRKGGYVDLSREGTGADLITDDIRLATTYPDLVSALEGVRVAGKRGLHHLRPAFASTKETA
jgi:hypothetical protein